MRLAILDDYQNIATSLADWASLGAEVVVFTQPFADADEVVRSLAGFDVLVAMRERTRFPAEVLERLPDLRLLVSHSHRSPPARARPPGTTPAPPAPRSMPP